MCVCAYILGKVSYPVFLNNGMRQAIDRIEKKFRSPRAYTSVNVRACLQSKE